MKKWMKEYEEALEEMGAISFKATMLNGEQPTKGKLHYHPHNILEY